MSDSLTADIEIYGDLAARLATAGDRRDALLAEHGIDDDAWDVIEELWSVRLEAAETAHGDADGVPPLLEKYANAFSRAQLASLANADVMPLEKYAAITRSLQRGLDMPQLFIRHDTSLESYLHSHSHWSVRLATEPDVARTFAQLLQT
jgi:hypothetical protein